MSSGGEKRQAVFERLTAVFHDVFDDDSIRLTEGTTAADIEDWDSLMHVTLCVAVEKQFRVRLNAMQIARLDNVGKMVDLLLELQH